MYYVHWYNLFISLLVMMKMRDNNYSVRWYGDGADLLPNPAMLVSVSKGMWAVKLCSNKILQFLTLGATIANCPV